MDNPQNVVFDTTVILQAALHPEGPAGRVLIGLDTGQIAVYVSPPLLEEYQSVLYRPGIRAKNPYFTDAMAETMLQRLDTKANLVPSLRRFVEYARDPNDEFVINLAIHVKADYLVAQDKDLLDLGRSRDFRLLYPFVRIVDPVTFLQEIEQKLEQDEQSASSEKLEGGEGQP